MDLLGGYHSSSSSSSDDDDDGDEKKQPKAAQQAAASVDQSSRSTPELVSSKLRRPPPGALNAAPLPSVPLAVLRSQGALVGGGPSSSAMVVASKTFNTNNGPIQGPVALHDPNDKTVR